MTEILENVKSVLLNDADADDANDRAMTIPRRFPQKQSSKNFKQRKSHWNWTKFRSQ